MHKHIHACTHKHAHIPAIRTNAYTHLHYTIILTFVNMHTQIHIITHRRRLTNTCAQAHSETHAEHSPIHTLI